MKPEDQTNAEFAEFYSHLAICAPITTGSNSSHKFSSHTFIGKPCNDGHIHPISADTYWEVLIVNDLMLLKAFLFLVANAANNTKVIMGLVPNGNQFCVLNRQ